MLNQSVAFSFKVVQRSSLVFLDTDDTSSVFPWYSSNVAKTHKKEVVDCLA